MKQYIVDAFTDQVFQGNPAAICIMEQWISAELMLAKSTCAATQYWPISLNW